MSSKLVQICESLLYYVIILHSYTVLFGVYYCTGVPLATLTSTPSVIDNTQCHRVDMTCMTQELTFLRWYNGSSVIALYTYNPMDLPPRFLFDNDGLTIEITDAVPEGGLSDVFNSTSVLTTTTLALSLLNVRSIQCGTGAFRSETIDLSMLNIQGQR